MAGKTITAVRLAAVFLLFGSTARVMAQEDCTGLGCPCSDDDPCGDGFLCQVVGVSACNLECPEGMPCPDDYVCQPQEFSACVPAPCEADADCGNGLKCVTVEYSECTKPLPYVEDEGVASAEPLPSACALVRSSYCAPPYVGPCEADANCGEGFRCVETQVCNCEDDPRLTPGGDGLEPPNGDPRMTPGGDGLEPPHDPRMTPGGDGLTCNCRPGGELYCEMKTIECASTEDCPDGWSCPPAYELCMDCGIDPEPPNAERCAPPPARICTPPAWEYGWAADADGVRPALNAATGAENARAALAADGPAVNGGSDGGCSAAPYNAGGLGWALIGLASLMLIQRRRRSR